MNFTFKLTRRLAVLGVAVFGLGCSDQALTDPVDPSNPGIARLVIVPDAATVDSNQTLQLQAYGLTNANDSVGVTNVAWSTSNAAVATVSSSGLLRGLMGGGVVVTAASGGRNGASNVTVRATTAPPGEEPVGHKGFQVSPSGNSSADGSAANPWSLAYAVSGAGGRIQPGDTVWLRAGTYKGKFVATVAGAAGKPVVFRQYPGERATIDVANSTSTTTRGDAFMVKGAWTVWWGFELMSSDPNRYSNTRPNMIVNAASNTKYINLVVHDGGIGLYTYASHSNVEVIGSIFYNNGWQGASGGGGHALYVKSNTGLLLRDNIVFNQFGYGIHAYSEPGDGALYKITLDGNVSFNNGSLPNNWSTTPNANVLFGGMQGVEQGRVTNNMAYFSPGLGTNNMTLGYSTYANADLTVQDNYAVGGANVLTLGYWSQVSASGNEIIGNSRVVRLKDNTLSGYSWGSNIYRRDASANAWDYGATSYTFSGWKSNTGLGGTDQVAAAPSAPRVFVRPSSFEQGRANIVVYNWGRRSSVEVNLAGVLPAGARYEVRNVQNFFGTPVSTGVFGGGSISIPMGGVAPAPVIGGSPHAPIKTGPDFDVFVVMVTS